MTEIKTLQKCRMEHVLVYEINKILKTILV